MSHDRHISIRRASDECYEVVLRSEAGETVTMEAASLSHARRVAGSLLLLARQKDSRAPLVLDLSPAKGIR